MFGPDNLHTGKYMSSQRRSLLGLRSSRAMALAALLTSCTPAAAPGPSSISSVTSPGPAGPHAIIPLNEYVAGLKTIEVAVAADTLPFLFDTGGGGALVTPEVAEAMGCEPFGRITGFRHTGEAVSAPRCGSTTLALAGWPVEVEAGPYDLMSLLRGAPVVGGLIGLTAFVGDTVTVDWGGSRLIVESPESFRTRIAEARSLQVRPSRQGGGAFLDIFVRVAAARGDLWLEMDSGNTGPVLLSPHAARQLGLELSPSEPRAVILEFPGFGPVEIMAVERETIYDGLLNAAFHSAYIVTLDLARMQAWMRESGGGNQRTRVKAECRERCISSVWAGPPTRQRPISRS